MKRFFPPALFALFFILFTPNFLFSLSFEEGYKRALANDLDIKQAEQQVRSAIQRKEAVIASYFPSLDASLSLSGTAEDILNENLSPNFSLRASQLITNSFSRTFNLKRSDINIAKQIAALSAKRIQILAKYEHAWFARIRSQDSLKAANKRVESTAKALDLARLRAEMGQISPAALLQAEATAATARAEALDASFSQIKAQKTLEHMLGGPLDIAEDEKPSIQENPVFIALEKWDIEDIPELSHRLLAFAQENESSLISLRLAVQEAGQTIYEDYLSYLPISASVNFDLSPEEKSLLERSSFSIQARLPILPLYPRIKESKNIQEQKALAEAVYQRALAERELAIWQKILDLIANGAKRASAQEAETWALARYTLVFERWTMGLENWQSLADAEASLASAEQASIARFYEGELTITELKVLVGLELTEDLLRAIGQ